MKVIYRVFILLVVIATGVTSCAEDEEIDEIHVADIVSTDGDEDPINPPPPPGNY